MSEEIRDDMSFEEMLKATEANANVYTGKIVKAKVISVSPTECIVGVDGSKHTGIVPLREMSHDPNAKMEDLVKEGDELDLVVVKTNDQEGVDTLSRVRFEAQKGMKDVSEAAENGTVMEGDVMEANKGGVVVNVKGVRVFVPRSQATMRRDEDYTKLVGQHVQLVITECAGRKIVGSINKVTAEANKAKREEFWANVEVGKQYKGVVKSLTSYGAFVDVGGVDGLVPHHRAVLETASSIPPRSSRSATISRSTSRATIRENGRRSPWATRRKRTTPGSSWRMRFPSAPSSPLPLSPSPSSALSSASCRALTVSFISARSAMSA